MDKLTRIKTLIACAIVALGFHLAQKIKLHCLLTISKGKLSSKEASFMMITKPHQAVLR